MKKSLQNKSNALNIKKGYKKTILGIIPEDWEYIKFGKIISKLGYGPRFSKNDYDEKGNVKTIRGTDVGQNGNIYYEQVPIANLKEDFIKPHLLKKGDLVMITTADCGVTGVFEAVDYNYIPSAYAVKISLTDLAEPNYFKFLVQSKLFKNQVIKFVRKGTVANLPGSDIKKFKFPLPPKPQQIKIAKILSTWDTAINKQTQLIQAKQKQKKALMQLLLTGKKRFDGFTEVWKKFHLKDVTDFKNGKGHEKNIDVNGKFTVVNSKFISTEGKVKKYSNMAFSPLQKDDIVLVMSDIPNGKALAKTFLIDENGTYTLNQRICSLKTRSDFNPKFLFYLINRNNYFLRFNDGVKQTNLRKDDVLFCSLKVPSFKEQKKIAQVLSKSDQEIALLKEQLVQLQQQKQGLMQVLLTGKVLVSV